MFVPALLMQRRSGSPITFIRHWRAVVLGRASRATFRVIIPSRGSQRTHSDAGTLDGPFPLDGNLLGTADGADQLISYSLQIAARTGDGFLN
jgi:hypothetical protein